MWYSLMHAVALLHMFMFNALAFLTPIFYTTGREDTKAPKTDTDPLSVGHPYILPLPWALVHYSLAALLWFYPDERLSLLIAWDLPLALLFSCVWLWARLRRKHVVVVVALSVYTYFCWQVYVAVSSGASSSVSWKMSAGIHVGWLLCELAASLLEFTGAVFNSVPHPVLRLLVWLAPAAAAAASSSSSLRVAADRSSLSIPGAVAWALFSVVEYHRRFALFDRQRKEASVIIVYGVASAVALLISAMLAF